jgi:hypothetical protein
VKLVGSRRPVGKVGETQGVFPGLSIGDRRLRGQAGIGAADCPQIHRPAPSLRYAASAATGAIVPKYASSGVCQPSA